MRSLVPTSNCINSNNYLNKLLVGSEESNMATINAITSNSCSISKYFNPNPPMYNGNKISSVGMFQLMYNLERSFL